MRKVNRVRGGAIGAIFMCVLRLFLVGGRPRSAVATAIEVPGCCRLIQLLCFFFFLQLQTNHLSHAHIPA